MYPKNTWYVAATAEEIADKPLGRRICGHGVVFFRNAEGQVAAVDDYCPHRGAPLSLGYVRDGQLVCGYHGLVMSCDGSTACMPGQRVRGFPRNRSFPVVERHGFVWLWPGDPEQADADRIPNLFWAEDPGWAYGGGVYRIDCDYRLMIDNLMDLTHETYVHATSIGQPEIEEVVAKTVTEGDQVITGRLMENIVAPPFWRNAMRFAGLPEDAEVDRWQICRFTPPSNVMIDVGVALAGRGANEAAPEHRVAGIVVDLITPETDNSIWYFWGLARNFKADDPALTATIREAQGKVFLEDVAMLEAQQRNLQDFAERQMLKLNIDAGGVQARRVIERLVAEERDHAQQVA